MRIVEGESVRSRLISARETVRLMGLPDSYVLSASRNGAYHQTGDGVAIPVVRQLARHVIEPILDRSREGFGGKPAASWKKQSERNCRRELESPAAEDGMP